MTYFEKYDLAYMDIMKNGTNQFTKLFEWGLGVERSKPVFLREPKVFITIVRNPYDRLVSQFYHINRRKMFKEYQHTLHYPIFREWVKESYENGYDGDDGHHYSQSHIIQYDKFPQLHYHIFKIEELVPSDLFFFLDDLTEERKSEINQKYKEFNEEQVKNKHHATGNIKQGIWQMFYDSETLQIANNYFKSDFEYFGYEMLNPSDFVESKRSIL